jgi:Skp family chaperone for outer membrane proteins
MLIKSGIRLAAGCLVVAALSVSGRPLYAQTPPQPQPQAAAASVAAPVSVVVDVDQVMRDSLAAKSARGQIEKFDQNFQAEGAKEESALRNRQKELEGLRSTLPQDQFMEKAREFDRSVAEYQRKSVMRRRALDRSGNAAMVQVQQAMVNAAGQVAVSHGANVVLARTQVLMFDEKMNVTKETIDILNKTLSHVDVPTPKPEAESDAAPEAGADAAPTPSKKKSQ